MQNISSYLSIKETPPTSSPKSKTIKVLLDSDSCKKPNKTVSNNTISKILNTVPVKAVEDNNGTTSNFDLEKSNEITNKILEAKNELKVSKKLEKKYKPKHVESNNFTKILKRKNYYEVCERQKIRIKNKIKQIFSESNNFLRSIGLCLSAVEINPIELDECDIKLNIRPPTNECMDTPEPNVNNLLFYKDKHSISDIAYADLKKRCHLQMPSICKLKQRRLSINSIFQIYENEMGVYLSLKDKLEFRIKILFDNKYSKEDLETEKFTDEIIHVKLSADGTNIGRNLKLLNFTFTIMNEGARAKTANGNYTIGIFEIQNENIDSLKKCFKQIIDEIRTLNEIQVYEKRLKLVFYFAGDWKILAHCLGLMSANSKYPCIWCKCIKDDFYILDSEWSITDPEKGCRTHEEHNLILNQNNNSLKYGYKNPPVFENLIPFSRYIIDMLHLYLRISDNLFNLLVKDCCIKDNFEMGNISTFHVTNYYHLSCLQNFLNEKCNVKFVFQWVPETKKLTWKDLMGPEKNRLFENFDLNQIIPSHENFALVSKIWKEFYKIMHQIKTVELKADELRVRTREWTLDFLKCYGTNNVTPYMHAFVFHLHEFISLYGDINAFNCQGLEKLNDLSTCHYFKGTNKRDSALRQMLQKRNRMEYLSAYIGEDNS